MDTFKTYKLKKSLRKILEARRQTCQNRAPHRLGGLKNHHRWPLQQPGAPQAGHLFTLIKGVFHAGDVLVTKVEQVHVKMVFVCFCLNAVQLGSAWRQVDSVSYRSAAGDGCGRVNMGGLGVEDGAESHWRGRFLVGAYE